METYIKPLADTMQALDFTSSVPRVPVTGPLESPILDLSCKKDLSSCESRWNLSSSGEKQPQVHQLPDSESQEVLPKSPFEGRTFMVTPPSESDSPKKIKYEAIYNCSNVNSMLGQPGGFPVLPMTVPFPVPGVISTMFKQNSTAPIPMVGSSVTSMTSSTTNESELLATSPEVGTKTPRPFKAYPKDPLSLSVGPTELMFDPSSNEAYSEFRKRMLESVRQSNEGTAIKMRRITKSASLSLPTSTVEEKDAAYRERRRKNNEAAKRSRDARRAKEDEIAIRAAFLEQENMKLKYELVALRNETAKLKCMVYST